MNDKDELLNVAQGSSQAKPAKASEPRDDRDEGHEAIDTVTEGHRQNGLTCDSNCLTDTEADHETDVQTDVQTPSPRPLSLGEPVKQTFVKQGPLKEGEGGEGEAPGPSPLSPKVDEHIEEHLKRVMLMSQVILAFKVSLYHKTLYSALSAEKKRLVKQGLIGLIEAVARKGSVEQVIKQALHTTINVNLNVPADLLKSSSKKECEEDRFLREKVKMLEEKLRDAEELIDYYKQKFREVKAEVLNLEATVKRKGNLELVIYLERIKKHLC